LDAEYTFVSEHNSDPFVTKSRVVHEFWNYYFEMKWAVSRSQREMEEFVSDALKSETTKHGSVATAKLATLNAAWTCV
jgi:hypothetical protein